MKKGFTLIELLAVIAMIGIILTLGTTSLISVLNNKKEKALEKTIDLIESAARNYSIDKDINNQQYINIQELCDEEYLSCPVLNPVTNEEMNGCVNMSFDSNGVAQYEYNSSCL